MSRWSEPAPVDDPREDDLDAPRGRNGQAAVAVDLAALPIVGLTRRRMAILISALLAAWIVVAFARQVGEASDATARSQDIASTNAAMRIEVAALERELELIARQRYIEQQARAYGLGGSSEVPFTLAVDAPPLPEDAPGSAALRVGARPDTVAPLERWLTVLFGPSG
jgi:cell division protein FtsB